MPPHKRDELTLPLTRAKSPAKQPAPAQAVSASVVFAVGLYVVTGIIQPLIVDFLKYQGFMGGQDPALPLTHMGVLLNTLGMSCVGGAYLVSNPWPKLTWRQYRAVGIACLVDLMAQQMVMFGQLKVGGGLYVLLYSSSMVWTAVLAQFVLKRELHYQQWMAVMEVMAGLVMSNLGLMLFDQGSSSGSSSPLMGSVVLLTGAMGAATYFISCEWILAGGADKSAPNAVPHMALAGMTGLSSMLITAIYNVGLAVAYGPSRLYAAPVAAAGGTWSHIAAVAPLLVLNNGLHAWSYFSMLNSIGAVSAGIMKGIRAAAVFVLSATIYCSVDEAQCVVLMEHGHLGPGILKVFAMYMIVRGVFAYSVAPRAAPPPEPVERDVNASFCSELSYGAF